MIKLNKNIAPRKWQQAALELWKEKLKGVVSVVTGGGKTLFAEMCMVEFIEQYPLGKVILVVPTISLLDQWYVSLQEDLELQSQEISCFSGEEKAKSLGLVNIFVINSARKYNKNQFENYNVLLIVDECHRAGSEVNSHALQFPHKAALGISATPERQYDEGFEAFIIPSLGPIIYRYDYAQAYQDNIICNFDLLNVKVDLLSFEQKKYDKLTKQIAIESEKVRRNRISDDRLKKLMLQRASVSNSAVMRIPVTVKLAEHFRSNRLIIFHERVEAAERIYNLLITKNHSVTIYHSMIGPFIRRDNLRLMRKGIFESLVTCKALDEGLNIPEIDTAIIASSTASIRQRIQRMGRVLRPAMGKEKARIITLYSTDTEETRLLREASTLSEISNIFWFHARRENNGENINPK